MWQVLSKEWGEGRGRCMEFVIHFPSIWFWHNFSLACHIIDCRCTCSITAANQMANDFYTDVNYFGRQQTKLQLHLELNWSSARSLAMLHATWTSDNYVRWLFAKSVQSAKSAKSAKSSSHSKSSSHLVIQFKKIAKDRTTCNLQHATWGSCNMELLIIEWLHG